MKTEPSTHWYILSARWVGIVVTALLLVMQQRPFVYWWLWLAAVGYVALATLFTPALVRLLVRVPLVAAVEITLGALLVVVSAGWTSPFFPVFLAALVLPAVLYGRNGGLFAGVGGSIQIASFLALSGTWGTDASPLWYHRVVFLTLPPAVALFAGWYAHTRRAQPTPIPSAFSRVERQSAWLDTLVRRSVPRFDSNRLVRRGEHGTALQTRVAEVRIALYAPPVPGESLLESISTSAERFEATAHIAVRSVVLGRPKPILIIHHDVIRRTVNEALLNVEEHAEAQSVSVLVRFDMRTVTILVQDDGRGLPDSGLYRAGMHSMQMLQYRISELGGRLEVFTPASGGVAVRAVFPLLPDEVIV